VIHGGAEKLDGRRADCYGAEFAGGIGRFRDGPETRGRRRRSWKVPGDFVGVAFFSAGLSWGIYRRSLELVEKFPGAATTKPWPARKAAVRRMGPVEPWKIYGEEYDAGIFCRRGGRKMQVRMGRWGGRSRILL